MDQLSERDLELHVKILAWLLIVSSAVFFLIGAFVLIVMAGTSALAGDPQVFGILSMVGLFVAGIFAILGLPGIIAGIGLLARAGWGRILAIIVTALGIFNFPVGTAIGAYALWVLLQRSADGYFGPPALRA